MKNARLLRDLYRANRRASEARWERLQADDLARHLAEAIAATECPPAESYALQEVTEQAAEGQGH